MSAEAVDIDHMSREARAAANAAVAQLSPMQRRILYLQYVAGNTRREIATILGIRPKEVSEHKSRALSKLRKLLAPEYLKSDSMVRQILRNLLGNGS